MASTTSYRSRQADFSDSDSSSSGDDADQPWKRQRKTRSRKSPMSVSSSRESRMAVSTERPTPRSSESSASNKRRRNNVWGQVVQQQEEEQVARDMTQFDMHRNKERDVESYNYRQDNLQRKSQPLGNPISFDDSSGTRNRKMPSAVGDSDDDSWLVDEPDRHGGIKDRLGPKTKEEEVRRLKFFSTMRPVTIRSNMHKKEVAGKISYSLQEPNRDMVKTTVDELGVEKAMAVWEQTRDIECNGGMLVNTGHRRRTPGGIFFQLLKTDPEVTKENKDVIFAMSKFQSKVDSKNKRKRRRKRHSHEKGMQPQQKANSMDVEVKQGEETKSINPEKSEAMDLEMKQEEVKDLNTGIKQEGDRNGMDLEVKEEKDMVGGNTNKESVVGNGVDGSLEHGPHRKGGKGTEAGVGDNRKSEHHQEEEDSSSSGEEEEEADIGKAIERRLLEIKRAKEKQSGDGEMEDEQTGGDGPPVETQNRGSMLTVDKNRGGEDADMEEGEVSD